ncbi:MAG: dynamin family protein [Acidobacteriota bacterium]
MKILDDAQRALFDEVRSAAKDTLAVLDRHGAAPEDRDALETSAERLEMPFLLVVVGEFNSGKSSFLNALLGAEVLQQGVTPTTSRIHVLRWGPEIERTTESGGVVRCQAPVELLREMELVDTPGTNAIEREHEALTRDYVPRSDLVLFVTSADRPFTQSERDFLESIREWGKKTVLIVNKVDILQNDQERTEVVDFVRQHGRELLGAEPETFPLSARRALADGSSEETSGLAELETWIRSELDQDERLRLKLSNPLGVAKRLVASSLSSCESALVEMTGDLETLELIESQSALYAEDLEREFGFRLGDVDGGLHRLENRGQSFFDEMLRLGRLPELLQRPKLMARFESEVVADMPQEIEARVSDIIDWMVDCELRQWRELQRLVRRRLDAHEAELSVDGPQSSSRKQLLETLGRSAQEAIDGFDRAHESSRLAESVKRSLAGAAVLEASAVGLGAIVAAAATTTAVDVTGILTAGSLAALGLFVLPARRRQAKRDLTQRLGALRAELMGGMRREFEREVARSQHRLRDAAGPYSRWVRSRRQSLEERRAALLGLEGRLAALGDRVAALAGGQGPAPQS